MGNAGSRTRLFLSGNNAADRNALLDELEASGARAPSSLVDRGLERTACRSEFLCLGTLANYAQALHRVDEPEFMPRYGNVYVMVRSREGANAS